MIKEINYYKYHKNIETLYFDVSNGSETPLSVKINLSASDSIKNYEGKLFFRSKITEDILDNSLFVDFFIFKELSIEEKFKKIKTYISLNPDILVKLLELNVV